MALHVKYLKKILVSLFLWKLLFIVADKELPFCVLDKVSKSWCGASNSENCPKEGIQRFGEEGKGAAFGAVWFKRVEYSKKQCDVLVVVGAVVEIYKSEKVETPLSADVQKYNQFLNQVFIENNKGKLSLDNREGYCEVDAGHILADSLGGDPLIRNTFPQDPGENVGQVWRNLERMIGDICVGKPNRVFWYFEYTDSKSTRPRQIHVELQSACLEKRFATFIIKNYLDWDVIKSPYTVEKSDTSVNTPCDFAKVFPDANGKDHWEYTHILEDGGSLTTSFERMIARRSSDKMLCAFLRVKQAKAAVYKLPQNINNKLNYEVKNYNQILNQMWIDNKKPKFDETCCPIHSGHILAASLGGPSTVTNTFPMDPTANRGGEWKMREIQISNCLKKYQTTNDFKMDLSWEFKYENDGLRPIDIIYNVSVVPTIPMDAVCAFKSITVKNKYNPVRITPNVWYSETLPIERENKNENEDEDEFESRKPSKSPTLREDKLKRRFSDDEFKNEDEDEDENGNEFEIRKSIKKTKPNTSPTVREDILKRRLLDDEFERKSRKYNTRQSVKEEAISIFDSMNNCGKFPTETVNNLETFVKFSTPCIFPNNQNLYIRPEWPQPMDIDQDQ